MFFVQNMIDMSMSTPIQDVSVYQFPLELVSQLLQEVSFVSAFLLHVTNRKQCSIQRDIRSAVIHIIFMRIYYNRCFFSYYQNAAIISQTAHEQIIVALTPLLENNHPTQEICSFFSKVRVLFDSVVMFIDRGCGYTFTPPLRRIV